MCHQPKCACHGPATSCSRSTLLCVRVSLTMLPPSPPSPPLLLAPSCCAQPAAWTSTLRRGCARWRAARRWRWTRAWWRWWSAWWSGEGPGGRGGEAVQGWWGVKDLQWAAGLKLRSRYH